MFLRKQHVLFRFGLCKPSSNLIKECSPWVHAWSMLKGSERELAWLCCVDRHLGQRRQLRDAAEWKEYQRTSNSSLSPNASSFSCLRLPRYAVCLQRERRRCGGVWDNRRMRMNESFPQEHPQRLSPSYPSQSQGADLFLKSLGKLHGWLLALQDELL